MYNDFKEDWSHQDTELYRYLLGIELPWTVERVKLDLVNQRVDVWANHEEDKPWPCPKPGAMVPLYDHASERTWRHLDSCQSMRRSFMPEL